MTIVWHGCGSTPAFIAFDLQPEARIVYWRNGVTSDSRSTLSLMDFLSLLYGPSPTADPRGPFTHTFSSMLPTCCGDPGDCQRECDV